MYIFIFYTCEYHVCIPISCLFPYMCACTPCMHEYVPHIPCIPKCMSFLEESKLMNVNNTSQKIRNISNLVHALLCVPEYTLCFYMCA